MSLTKLSALLAELREAAPSIQLGMLPGEHGGLALILAWDSEEGRHEVAQHFTGAEMASATDAQLETAINALAAAAWEQIERKADTPEDATSRILAAAMQAPKHHATQTLIGAAQ